ncbi:MAG: peptide deformylase [Ignavibacteria bacterium]|nr:peptide deformylase [Ignavibacteria bacterium]
MSKYKIFLFGTEILREKSKPVTVFNKKLHALLDNLYHVLYERGNGAAIAAPQIGIAKRVIAIDYLGEKLELINPEILAKQGTSYEYEGCLSLPGFVGKVRRAETVSIRFRDRYGIEQTLTRSKEMARCIQHEIDHLEGILYTDLVEESFLIEEDTEQEKPLSFFQEITAIKNK